MKKNRHTTLVLTRTEWGIRSRCSACGTSVHATVDRGHVRGPNLCPACGRFLTTHFFTVAPERKPSDIALAAAILIKPRCQNDLLPRMRHVHAAAR